MGNCNICGSNFKMLGGGKEPYTGCDFTVCNTCGDLLKKIDQAKKNRESQQCISLSVELLDRCKDPDTELKVKQYTDKALEKAQEDLSQEGLDVFSFCDSEDAFLATTGYSFEGYKIESYLGIVSGDVVLGTGFFSEFSMELTDLFGERSTTASNKMKEVKWHAYEEMLKNAKKIGANALIGVDFDYVTLSNNILGVSANGTAVKIEKVNE